MKDTKIKKQTKQIIAISLITAGVLGITLTAWWYVQLAVTKSTVNSTPSNQLSLAGSLYILQRNTPVAVPSLQLQAVLYQHSISNSSVSSVIQLLNSDGTVAQTVTFNNLHEVQVVHGHSLQLQSASVDAVQIVVK